MRRARVLPVLLVVALTGALAGCSRSSVRSGSSGPGTTLPHVDVLVALGSGATFGDGLTNPLSDSWPQVLYHIAFPHTAVLVNASDRGVKVESAIKQELPLALEEHATVATVWLGDDDIGAGVPAATFETELDQLVGRLREAGSRVLLGNLPTGVAPSVAAYNDVIARVARNRGATLVDLASALAATPTVGPSSAIGVSESRIVARAFAAALVRS